MQFGLLTGKFTSDTVFSSDDHRSFRFNREILHESINALEELKWPLCKQYGIIKTSLPLSYILSYDSVSTVIPHQNGSACYWQYCLIVQIKKGDVELITKAFDTQFATVVNKGKAGMRLMERVGGITISTVHKNNTCKFQSRLTWRQMLLWHSRFSCLSPPFQLFLQL